MRGRRPRCVRTRGGFEAVGAAVCIALLAVILATAIQVDAAPAAQSSVSTAPLHDFGTTSPPPHGTTTLYRNDDGIAITVDTRHLRRNSAHTFWIVIFNAPGECAASPCGLPDLGNAATLPSLVFGGAAVTDYSGQLRGSAGLDAGVAPAPPLRFGFGPGRLFPHLAEIHIIVQDHLGVDFDQIHAMLQRPGTGPDGVVDVQSSIHLPGS